MSSSASSSGYLRWIIIGVGLLTFVLLFFADKTNLSNQQEITAPVGLQPDNTEAETPKELPPLASDPELDRQLESLEQAEGEEKIRLLDTIVVSLQARNRFAYAADYAGQLVRLDSSLDRLLLAGQLSQKATELPFVQADSALLRRYATESVALLSRVLEEQPEQEEAQLSLGLAQIYAGAPMQGILTLRSLAEKHPENWQAQLQLGRFSLQTGQADKAESRFESVLRSNPDLTEAKVDLAVAKMQLQKNKEAIGLLEEVLEDKTASAELKQSAKELLNQLKK